MLRQDYVLKLIEELGGALKRLLRKRNAKNEEEQVSTNEELETLYSGLFGISSSMVETMDAPSIAAMLASPEEVPYLAQLVATHARLWIGTDLSRASTLMSKAAELSLLHSATGEESPAALVECLDALVREFNEAQ